MELKHIELARLSVSGLNMRGTRKACDIANILPYPTTYASTI